MRKRFAFSVVAVLLISGPVAQAQLSYGAKLGMGFPGFINDTIASQRITLAVGLTGSLKLSDRFQIMTELGFQRKGNKYSTEYNPLGQESSDSAKVITNLDYITVPLYLRVNIGRTSKFYFQAGGYYGYLIHANFSGMRSGELIKKEPIRDNLFLHDFGLIGGGGIETPIRPGLGVILDIKYQYGLKDLNKKPAIIGNSQPIKNKGLSLSMGFYIDIE
jgi:hypothetical protein